MSSEARKGCVIGKRSAVKKIAEACGLSEEQFSSPEELGNRLASLINETDSEQGFDDLAELLSIVFNEGAKRGFHRALDNVENGKILVEKKKGEKPFTVTRDNTSYRFRTTMDITVSMSDGDTETIRLQSRIPWERETFSRVFQK